MSDDDARRIGALGLEDPELVEPDRRQDAMRGDSQAGPPSCPRAAGGPAPRRRHPRLVGPDLPDDPGPDAGVADPLGRLVDELVGEVVDGAPVDQRFRG